MSARVVERYFVTWKKPSGEPGETKPIINEDEARKWLDRIKAWWPERAYKIEKREVRLDPDADGDE